MDPLRSFFEDLASDWDAQQAPNRAERLGEFLACFDSLWQAANLVLDVGTGTSMLLPLLQERALRARVVAIDLAHAMLLRARARSERECDEARRDEVQPRLAQADAHRLPFHAQVFDAIVCHSSFPHLENKPAALLELKRALRPGGRLIILHDISREKVNHIHQTADPVVRNDLLPAGPEMFELMKDAGLVEIYVNDAPDHYLAVGGVPTGEPGQG